jgi:NADP-dependent 3-hydroxy acid dehydrogenase YdfG
MAKNLFLDQVAVVTGASSGIGCATALELARAGAHVALGARSLQKLERVAEEVRALGREALVVPTDVTIQDQVERLIRETQDRWGRVDILISNAGEYIRSPITQVTIPMLERSMAVNFYGGVYAVLAVLPHMLSRRQGHIVLVTSMDARKGLPLDAPYVAAKFASCGFGEVLRQELHGTGVYTTTVFPGRVDTPMIDDLVCPWVSAKIPADAVAKAILRAVQRRQPEVFIPSQTRLLYYLNVLSPGLADWAARRLRLEGWSKIQ